MSAQQEPHVLHDRAIGVFDSGLGGLTVVQALRRRLPTEALLYLGDTARVPYGTRTAPTVIRYARACAHHLAKQPLKLLVVACNTVSAVALDMLSVELDVPVVGVIKPGARAGVAASTSETVGVIATRSTAASGAYPRAVAEVSSRVETFVCAAPLLVPLVEEGWVEGDVPALAVRRYLKPLVDRRVGSLILGCTHYPLLHDLIDQELDRAGHSIPVVDSARESAKEVAQILQSRGLSRRAPVGQAPLRVLVTDRPEPFAEQAARFLGEAPHGLDVQQVDL